MLLDDFYSVAVRGSYEEAQDCVQTLLKQTHGDQFMRGRLLVMLSEAGDDLVQSFFDRTQEEGSRPLPPEFLFKGAYCLRSAYYLSDKASEFNKTALNNYNFAVALIDSCVWDGLIDKHSAPSLKPIQYN